MSFVAPTLKATIKRIINIYNVFAYIQVISSTIFFFKLFCFKMSYRLLYTSFTWCFLSSLFLQHKISLFLELIFQFFFFNLHCFFLLINKYKHLKLNCNEWLLIINMFSLNLKYLRLHKIIQNIVMYYVWNDVDNDSWVQKINRK